jgi:hypothetical protein
MDLDAIWKRARSDLTITTKHGDPDVFLWEHSSRVARVAQRIAQLPEVRSHDPDELAVVAAALYHDAGWAIRSRAGEIDRTEVLLGPTTDTAGEQAAALMEQGLSGMIPPGSLERATRAIHEMAEREPGSIEAQVIVEANNLEEFGLLMLWPSIRRGMVDGKGIQAVIESWRRKKEYQFWNARLRDSFRFAPVRAVAERRLERLEQFMLVLEEQHQGADIDGVEALRPAVPQRQGKSA